MKKFKLRYQVDQQVQPWMGEDEVVKIGEVVYLFSGCTYGCIGAGVAVTRQPDQTPFFEVPRDALEEVA
jgi:hypothetical protein